jgi:anti-sigma factor RsiW
MRCREARRSILERDLGTLPPTRGAELERHLAACRACALHAASEAQLTADLVALAATVPPVIDVTEVVARRLRALPPGRSAETPAGPYGWAVAAAFAGCLAVGWTALGLPAAATDLGRELLPLLGALRSWVEALGSTALTIVSAIAHALTDVALPLIRGMRRFALPVVSAMFLMMSATVAAVVARDLLRRRASGENHR